MVDKPVLKKKDFESDQAVRWCPGCGDYAILAQTQKVFPEITTDKEKVNNIWLIKKSIPFSLKRDEIWEYFRTL